MYKTCSSLLYVGWTDTLLFVTVLAWHKRVFDLCTQPLCVNTNTTACRGLTTPFRNERLRSRAFICAAACHFQGVHLFLKIKILGSGRVEIKNGSGKPINLFFFSFFNASALIIAGLFQLSWRRSWAHVEHFTSSSQGHKEKKKKRAPVLEPTLNLEY